MYWNQVRPPGCKQGQHFRQASSIKCRNDRAAFWLDRQPPAWGVEDVRTMDKRVLASPHQAFFDQHPTYSRPSSARTHSPVSAGIENQTSPRISMLRVVDQPPPGKGKNQSWGVAAEYYRVRMCRRAGSPTAGDRAVRRAPPEPQRHHPPATRSGMADQCFRAADPLVPPVDPVVPHQIGDSLRGRMPACGQVVGVRIPVSEPEHKPPWP